MLLGCAIAGLGLLAGGAAAPGDGQENPLRPVPRAMKGLPGTIGMDLSSGVPIVEAQVGEHALRLIVDTGASMTVFLPASADRIGLETRDPAEVEAVDAAGEAREVKAAHIEKLALPSQAADPVLLGDFDVIVMESAMASRAGVDGILGLPVFRRTVTRFDFARRELALGVDPLPDADGQTILKLHPAANGLVAIEARFTDDQGQLAAGPDRTLLLDTGFSGNLHLPRRAAEALGIAAATTQGTAVTAHDQRAFERTPLEADLHLGRYRVERPSASVFVGDDRGRMGAVGMGILSKFVMTLDPVRRRVRLEAQDTVIEPSERQAALPADAGGP
jgi:predicted aspartyl protease